MDLMDVRRELMGVIASMASGSGTDVIIKATASNTIELVQQILSDFETGKSYVGILKSTTNQNLNNLIPCFVAHKVSDSVFGGGALRYRNGIYNSSIPAINTTYDAATTIGDVYTVYEYK